MKLSELKNNKEHCENIFQMVFLQGAEFNLVFIENKYGIDGVVLTGFAGGVHSILTIFEDGVIRAESQLVGEQYVDVDFNCFEIVEKLINYGYKRS